MNSEKLTVLQGLKQADADELLSAGNFERYEQLSKDLITAIKTGLIKSELKHLRFIFHSRRIAELLPHRWQAMTA